MVSGNLRGSGHFFRSKITAGVQIGESWSFTWLKGGGRVTLKGPHWFIYGPPDKTRLGSVLRFRAIVATNPLYVALPSSDDKLTSQQSNLSLQLQNLCREKTWLAPRDNCQLSNWQEFTFFLHIFPGFKASRVCLRVTSPTGATKQIMMLDLDLFELLLILSFLGFC